MENKYLKQTLIAPSMSDGLGFLSHQSTFALFMDMAMEHAMKLGIGLDYTMPRGMYWITVRTRVNFIRRPHLSDIVESATWPEKPSMLRTNRYYPLTDGEGVCVEGKTEWAIINMQTGRPEKLDKIFAPDFEFCNDVVCEEPFMRICEDFSDGEFVGEIHVGSGDIDMGHHMNNVMYIREVLNLFSLKELEKMNIREIEVCYRSSCFEHDVLKVWRRDVEDGAEFGVFRGEGAVAVLLHMKYDK